jgi:hypothetical protein
MRRKIVFFVCARPTHVPCESDVSDTPRQIERMCGMDTERTEEDENAGTGEAAGGEGIGESEGEQPGKSPWLGDVCVGERGRG